MCRHYSNRTSETLFRQDQPDVCRIGPSASAAFISRKHIVPYDVVQFSLRRWISFSYTAVVGGIWKSPSRHHSKNVFSKYVEPSRCRLVRSGKSAAVQVMDTKSLEE
nr:hypothetical protein CFP56_46690 [Quercus suber]